MAEIVKNDSTYKDKKVINGRHLGIFCDSVQQITIIDGSSREKKPIIITNNRMPARIYPWKKGYQEKDVVNYTCCHQQTVAPACRIEAALQILRRAG